nr:hypothetical protein CFP56_40718 [Quercus suber]
MTLSNELPSPPIQSFIHICEMMLSTNAGEVGQGVEGSSNASAQCPISKEQCEQLLALFNTGTDQGQGVEGSSNASAQCPISKEQCEQLLALFNTGTDQGANHHVATVSTSGAVSNTLPRAPGVSAATGVPSSSFSPSNNASCSFVDTMSDPFGPTAIEASCLADVDEFVTPINIPDPASLDFDNVSSPSAIVQPIPNVFPSHATFSSPIQRARWSRKFELLALSLNPYSIVVPNANLVLQEHHLQPVQASISRPIQAQLSASSLREDEFFLAFFYFTFSVKSS